MTPIDESSAPALLFPSEIDAIRSRNFELACPQITVSPMTEDGSAFSGPGTIKIDLNGEISFSCIAPQRLSPEGFMAIVNGPSRQESGKILPPAYLYRVEALDFSGRKWNSEKINPDIHSHSSGTHIKGKLFELNCVSSNRFDISSESAQIEFAGDYAVPTTSFADVVVDSTGKEIVWGPRDLLKFDTKLARFRLHYDSNALRVSASGDALSSVVGLETRITETLQFVLARPLTWSVFTLQSPKMLIARLRSAPRDVVHYSLFPPIGNEMDTASSFVELFDKYLVYVTATPLPVDRLHPVSARMRAVCHASASPLDASVLALSVAIEGLLPIVLADSDRDIGIEERKWIRRAQACIRTLPGSQALRDRAIGALSLLYRPNAKGRLDHLVAMNAINASQRDAWQALRHKHAHGELVDSESIDTVLEYFYRSLVMFYRLVFLAIGYQGKYVDYGSPGWPTSQLPQRDTPAERSP